MENKPALIHCLLLAAGLMAPAIAVNAQTYWDPGNTAAAPGSGGSGTWDNVTLDWYNGGSSDVAWPAGNVATFAGAPAFVVLGDNVSASGLDFVTNGGEIIGSGYNINLAGPANVTVPPGGTTTFNSVTLTGSAGMSVSGGGTLIETGNSSTYTGSTTINSGTEVQISADASAASSPGSLGETPATTAANNVVLAGGTLSGSAVLTLYKTRGISVTAPNSAIDVDLPGTSAVMTIGGPIADGGNGLTKTSAGTLDLAVANTISGPITILGGTFQPSGSATLNGSNPYTNNMVLTAVGANPTNPASFNNESSTGQTLSGTISGNGLFAQNGTGTLTLAGTNTYTGFTTIDHGSVTLTSTGSIADSPFVFIYNTGSFNVSAYSTYNWPSGTSLGAAGVGTASEAKLIGVAGGTINLGSVPLTLYYNGGAGSSASQPLIVTAGSLKLNNNSIGVSNESGTLGTGTYNLIEVATPGSISGTPASPICVVGGNFGLGIASGTLATASVSGQNVVMTVASASIATTTTTPTSTGYGTFTATVTPASGTLTGGVVQFLGDSLPMGTPVAVNTATGVATLNFTSPMYPVGPVTNFVALYSGNGSFAASASASEMLTITNSFPPITLAATNVPGGLEVCWNSVPGVTYNVLTNGILDNSTPWVVDTGIGPITATLSNTCVTIPGPLTSPLYVTVNQ